MGRRVLPEMPIYPKQSVLKFAPEIWKFKEKFANFATVNQNHDENYA
jgi:hypothetical protein